MIIYNITLSLNSEIESEWLVWMKESHIPDVLDTGMFIEAKLSRVLAEEEGGVTYSVQYLCASMDKLDDYKKEYAPKLQADHMKKFAGKFVAFRTLLRVEKHLIS